MTRLSHVFGSEDAPRSSSKLVGPDFKLDELYVPYILGNLYLDPSFVGKKRNEILDALEQSVEKAVLDGKVIVVAAGCLPEDVATRIGTVPLRWGARRLLLVTPEQDRALERSEELFRAWRLWRYQFDPKTDARIVGSPKKALVRLSSKLDEVRFGSVRAVRDSLRGDMSPTENDKV